ncbi:MAG: hypothetical protein EPN34_06135 [Burkholderiaceae bacterium]|nr:MAG: hypothetical protein EPN34_06135 [Burkholderiaceae bacterium]
MSIKAKTAAGELPSPISVHDVVFSERSAGLYGPEVTHVTHPLHGLPPELRAVVLADPKKIPAYIRALGADAPAALQQHAISMNRGYLVTKAPQGHYIPTSHVPGVTFV